MSSHDEIVVFTDGSTTDNGFKTAKSCSAVVFPNKEIPDSFFFLPPESTRSNNRAEYYAGIKAMELSNEYDIEKIKTLHIYTDSMLLLNTCTKWMKNWEKKGWKKSGNGIIKNLDLVKILYDHCNERKIEWTHVKAHTGLKDYNSFWNDKVDKLASENCHKDDISYVVFEKNQDEYTPSIKSFFNKKRKSSD